jgi:hypothetical protein
MLSIMSGGSETILVVCQQIHGHRTIPSEREAVAHPAIAGSKIQYPPASIGWIFFQDMLDQVVVSSRPNMPLLAVPSRPVHVGKTEIELFALAASTLCFPNAFIVFHEPRVMGPSLRRDGMHDFIDDLHPKSTRVAIQPIYIRSATRTSQTNYLIK